MLRFKNIILFSISSFFHVQYWINVLNIQLLRKELNINFKYLFYINTTTICVIV